MRTHFWESKKWEQMDIGAMILCMGEHFIFPSKGL